MNTAMDMQAAAKRFHGENQTTYNVEGQIAAAAFADWQATSRWKKAFVSQTKYSQMTLTQREVTKNVFDTMRRYVEFNPTSPGLTHAERIAEISAVGYNAAYKQIGFAVLGLEESLSEEAQLQGTF